VSTAPAAGVRLARLLQLVPWLLARPGIPVAEAAAHFGVTEEQLGADLDLLICSGPGLQHGELLDIWYWEDNQITVKDPQSLTRPLRLTAEEAAALLVGLRVLSQVPGPHDREAVARVSATLEEAAGAAASAGSAVAVGLETQADPEIVATVTRAVDEGRLLHIRYAGAVADEETERDVDPHSLLSVDGRPYLSGWCRSAGAMRTFRLDRVRAATVLAEPAQVPAGASGPDLGRGGLRPDGPPAVLDLAPGARWVVEEYPVDTVEEGPDGTTRVTLPVSDQRWILRLLLRLGPAARVVSPPELSLLVAEEAAAALAAYS
jgi:proteasome accessory factor C